MIHNIFAVAVADMDSNYAVPVKMFLVERFNAILNFDPRCDAPKYGSLGLFIAAPHQASITHYRVGFTIILGLEKIVKLVTFLENLFIRTVHAVDGWLVPPRREEGTRE
ncbi:hypothetical protein MesoLj113a_74420 [Mesorhizobium sp. 113-1-2]|nr:Solute carrier family 35 member F3 [Mesorhizobium loti]BCG76284.1 hypothetical protein MesoLj113a_74420 [Mesorhizobium sp. 113-1-2]BCG83028.1 hypothetical protein MesoLj113b_65700 [Mesorhizobium sp. 113-3-3]BCG90906.1 hypothetical protein MesoLj113c_70160 [Mesorhizobium sp. 113-3-9]BCG97543.1 hypothetical protein MesoLj131a_64070 [Mesorhizobium sp. 131-2-1]BCH04610.1 hypothetical protein MesoLj131b_66090 [Mesorhizobium sp. 131-2-5]BCH12424.1 hypothetical protein MesoLj131c_66820 [Mesorhizo